MITFELFVKKSAKLFEIFPTATPKTVSDQSNPTLVERRWLKPVGFVVSRQTAYNSWLESVGLSIGDIVTLSYDTVYSTGALSMIAYIERDFNKVGIINGAPTPYLMVQIGRYTGRRHVRWDNNFSYRRATQEELTTLIGTDADYDNLRVDCISEGQNWLASHKYLESSPV